MTTVEDVGNEVGRSVGDVLAACEQLGILASGPTSGLSAAEHERLRTALDAPANLPPVQGGSAEVRPGSAPGDTRTLRERAAALDKGTRKPRLSIRTAMRIVIYSCLLIAIAVAVTTIRDRADETVTVPVVEQWTAADRGTCVDLSDGSTRSRPTRTDCSVAHDAEIYLVDEVAESIVAFPGSSRLVEIAQDSCTDAFTAYVGVPYAESSLDAVFLVPSPETWSIGDRTVLCLVEDPAAPLLGSVADSGR